MIKRTPGWEYLENPVIDEAAAWIAKHRLEIPYPPIPFIREKFDFSNKETIEAFERANAIRRRGND